MKQPLILALLALSFAACGKSKPTAPSAPSVTVSKPLQKEVVEWDEYTGRLEAIDRVEVRAQVSGYLESIHFKDGDIVKKGDLLFVIDQRPYQAVLDRANAQVQQAQAALALADANLKRTQELAAKSAVASQELDDRRSKQLEAAAALQVAQAESNSAKLNLDFTQITAPVTGRASRHEVSEGNLINGGSGQATVLTTIVSLDPIHCYFEADERAFLKYLRMSQTGERPSSRDFANPAQIELADEQGFPHKGKMDFVENRLDPGTDTIQGRAIFENKDLGLIPGLFVRLRLLGSGKYQALLLPDEAINSDQSQKFIWVVKPDDTVEYRKIDLGPMIDGLRVIHDGLKADERVIVDGIQRARPGIKVKPEERAINISGMEKSSAVALPAGLPKQTGETVTATPGPK